MIVGDPLNGSEAEVSVKPERREWLRVSDAMHIYSLSRAIIYEMIRNGEIRSVLLRKRGNVSGSRRIFADSLDDYFARFLEKEGKS
jgi:hypothetical protein